MLKNLSAVIIIGMSILTPYVGFTGSIVKEERSEEMPSSNTFLDKIEESNFDMNIIETEASKISKDDLSISPEEIKDGEKALINGEVVTHTWGSVSWTWDEETKTIELDSGDAGTVTEAPWKTYPSVVKIIFKNKVVFPSDSSEMFFNSNLEIIENSRNIDVSNVSNMARMFYQARSLTELDVSNWDVSSVTDMSSM
ncbi:BspA family leucine-rich repeat surface protein, partial [Enterococcus gallinarum]|uniref:BspA family leucine-rich repeat surface protein n=1 Tax=Enterococcus gallinarum TaxID=1353 RepID=UPI003D6BDAF8